MRRLPEVCWLELPRFTRAELAAQLAGLRGGPVDSQVVEEVFDRSQGNPFFAEQLFARPEPAPARLPGLLREVLLAQVRQLSPAGQQLLQVAAVAGRWVCHDWLAAVAARRTRAGRRAAEAVGAGCCRSPRWSAPGRRCMSSGTPCCRRRCTASCCPGSGPGCTAPTPTRWPALPGTRLPQFAAELAEHWYRAGQPGEALAWSVRAADSAERVYAHGEAARHCERALELWDQVPDAAGRAGRPGRPAHQGGTGLGVRR